MPKIIWNSFEKISILGIWLGLFCKLAETINLKLFESFGKIAVLEKLGDFLGMQLSDVPLDENKWKLLMSYSDESSTKFFLIPQYFHSKKYLERSCPLI